MLTTFEWRRDVPVTPGRVKRQRETVNRVARAALGLDVGGGERDRRRCGTTEMAIEEHEVIHTIKEGQNETHST